MAEGLADPREQGIIWTSIIGIVANVLLAAFKAAVGALSHSIAIMLDAVNNLSDAMSSVITIVGTRLAGKSADREHPFGYGRIEYMATMVIGAIVLSAGASSALESVQQIISPEETAYSPAMLVIVGVAVAAKLVLGAFFKRRGAELGSDSLTASGEDASLDAVLSAGTLVAALASIFAHISIEAWIALAISGFIIKAGIDILREAISKILGERIEADTSIEVKACAESVEGVAGAYDLILTDYGPSRLMGSVHIEVDENLSAREIDVITRTVQKRVLEQCGVILHTVGIYSANSGEGDAEPAAIRAELERLKGVVPHVREIHALFVDTALKKARFDAVISFDAPDRREVLGQLVHRLEEAFPGYEFAATLDSDISD